MAISWRVRAAVLLAILWVAFGHMATTAFNVFGIWYSLFVSVLFAISLVGTWRDRTKPSTVGLRRLWAGWLFALIWTILTAIASVIQPEDAQTGWLWIYRVLLNGDAQGLELAIRNFHLAFSILFIGWSGIELSVATYRSRASSSEFGDI